VGKVAWILMSECISFSQKRRGPGVLPCIQKRDASPQGGAEVFGGCVYTQPVLAIPGKLPVGSLREQQGKRSGDKGAGAAPVIKKLP